jgi:predicted adenylyl cyclase CyaB
MPENLEIKLKVARLGEFDRTAKRIGKRVFDGWQIDTYFRVRSGRLKLRETGSGAELIFYRRPNKQSARRCDYLTVKIEEPQKVKSFLADFLGVKQVVKKYRRVYLYRTARLQLDRVTGLGTFVEIEIPSQGRRSQARRLMRSLVQRLNLHTNLPIPGSYSDLLLQHRK